MNKQIFITLSLISFFGGILGYALYNKFIVVQFNHSTSPLLQPVKTKKMVTLYFWHNNRWYSEVQEIIWSSHPQENIEMITTAWLTLLDTENIIPKKAVLQSAALSINKQEVYLSFDRNILPKQWSIHRKVMLLEGLFKTLRDNSTPIALVHILVHHQPLIDSHLDFTLGWPLNGFWSSNCNIS